MHDFLSQEVTQCWSGEDAGFRSVADQVIGLLAARARRAQETPAEALMRQLFDAVCATDPDAVGTAVEAFRVARVQPDAVIDLYVPTVARLLGEAWICDRASFAEVTIGTARLQALVRALASERTGPRMVTGNGPTIVLIVPEFEDHTLGAVIAADQFRREGISVNLQIKPKLASLIRLVAEKPFDAALLSVANVERLEPLRKIVDALAKAARGRLRVMVGGSILGREENVAKATGAEIAAGDVRTLARMLTGAHARGDAARRK
jgi:methanogenic corrinoid protein MtbC1